MRSAVAIFVVAVFAAAVWLLLDEDEPTREPPEPGFTDLPPPRGDVPMPDTALAVPAQESSAQPDSDAMEVRFPDGDRVEIRWREPEQLSFEVTGNATTDYVPLRLAAEAGDGLAAFTLAMNLEACRQSYRDESALQAAIDKLRQTGMLDLPGLDHDIEIPSPGETQSYVDELTTKYEACRNISDRQIAETELLIGMSAEAGNPMGEMEYGRRLDDDVAKREYYERAWQGGQMHALLFLAESYRAGYDDGLDPVDKLRWYAAYFLHGQLSGAPHDTMLEQAEKELLPREVDEALAIAKDMLRSNPNCCERAY